MEYLQASNITLCTIWYKNFCGLYPQIFVECISNCLPQSLLCSNVRQIYNVHKHHYNNIICQIWKLTQVDKYKLDTPAWHGMNNNTCAPARLLYFESIIIPKNKKSISLFFFSVLTAETSIKIPFHLAQVHILYNLWLLKGHAQTAKHHEFIFS